MVSLYSIKRNQFYRVIESDKHEWVTQCKRKKECDCPWRIRATKNKGNLDKCREHLRGLSHLHVDDRVLAYVRAAGFYILHRLVATVPLDKALLTALLERWRPETHSFHLPVGEVTVTLGDVVVLTRLEVDGRAVIGTACRQWVDECERLLGICPVLRTDLQGSSLRMPWLREHFQVLPPDADEVMIQQHARAYILMLMGASIFANKSGNEI
ncbi:unnamed protein product [Cuscuta epithymum]|uniref:Aminotransferase-like plant mobile domain-containing protein n=1 Tax=Cuscuta epithymum TaxID=186058 RepID=A0AAV0GA74_9ASTE|nr:unnamed protein product [Cuscuta epithymum]CAH9144685.1 unnamed protein product [Cuscuta epithymum]